MRALLCLLLTAAPAGWVTVDTPTFTAQFPKKPERGVLEEDPGTEVHQVKQKLADGREWEVVLSVSTPPEEVRSKAKPLTADELRQVVADVLAPEDFSLLTDEVVSVPVQDKSVPGRDFTARNSRGVKLSGRVLTYQGRLFQLLSFHPAKRPLDAEHKKFIDRFKLK